MEGGAQAGCHPQFWCQSCGHCRRRCQCSCCQYCCRQSCHCCCCCCCQSCCGCHHWCCCQCYCCCLCHVAESDQGPAAAAVSSTTAGTRTGPSPLPDHNRPAAALCPSHTPWSLHRQGVPGRQRQGTRRRTPTLCVPATPPWHPAGVYVCAYVCVCACACVHVRVYVCMCVCAFVPLPAGQWHPKTEE